MTTVCSMRELTLYGSAVRKIVMHAVFAQEYGPPDRK